MKAFLIGALKYLAACSGPGCILYAINLFERHFELGKQSQDLVHTVLVNNHGTYRYITEEQNHNFWFFLAVGVILLLAMFASIAIQKVRDNRSR
jgi:hypothetical protein